MYKISKSAMEILASWASKASRSRTLDTDEVFQLFTDLNYIVNVSRDEQDRTWKDRPAKWEKGR